MSSPARGFSLTMLRLWQALRYRAALADQIAQNLRRILDETEVIPEESKGRVRGSVEASSKKAAPYLFWRLALHVLNSEHYLLMLIAAGSALPILRFGVFHRAGGAALIAILLLVAVAIAGGGRRLLPAFGRTRKEAF